MTANPIRLPGLYGGPHEGPLIMCEAGTDHRDYFAFVDGTRASYQRFTAFAEPDRLSRYGHLVFVSGPTGVGKSSFIALCARHLRDTLKVPVAVVNYGQAAVAPDGDFDRAAKQLFREIVGVIKSESWMSKETLDSLRTRMDNLQDAYEYLGDLLEEGNAIMAVILPQKIPLAWVQNYYYLTQKRIMFLAEGANDAEEDFRAHVGNLPGRPSLFLSLGLLEPENGDILTFLNSRVDRDGSVREMTDEERRLACRAVRPAQTVTQVEEELTHLFDLSGSMTITPSLVQQYMEQALGRLFTKLARDDVARG